MKEMTREKSCGAVIYRLVNGVPHYLVLHSTQRHWTLCKGHVEGDEAEHETATREIMEETGLSVTFEDGFREMITYSPHPGVMKDVIFFLAQAKEGPITCQACEVLEAGFFPLAEALAHLTHASDRDVLDKADCFLKVSQPL